MVGSVAATRMDRRRFLGAGAAVLAGGCLDRAALAGSTPSPAASVGGTARDCDGGIAVTADPFAAGDVTVPLDDGRRTLVAEAVEEGAAEVVSYGETSLDREVFVRYAGAFYETDYVVTTTELPAYRLSVSWTRGRRAPADATVVPFGRLPRADRRALTLAVHGGEAGRVRAGDDGEGPTVPQASMSVRRFPAPYPNGGEGSRLVDAGVVWVSWEGRTYRVEIGGTTTTERRTRRYRVERVADDAAGFRRAIESEFAVRLDRLSRRERAIVGRAISADGGYEECTPASDALERLRARLPDRKRLPTPDAGSWYVRIGDAGYVLTLTRRVA